MAQLTPTANLWLAGHHGVITVEQLTRRGITRKIRLRLIADGVLVPIYKGVYRVASSPLTLEARCVALSAAHEKGYVTDGTGGRLLGLRRMPKADGIDFCVPHGLELDPPEVRLRQTTKLEPTDYQERHDGIRLASPWRLAFDLARHLSADAHASVVEQILDRRLCSVSALIVTSRRLVHPNRPGSARFIETLLSRVPGGIQQSDAEVQLAKRLRARGVPVESQHRPLELPDGTPLRIDLAVPSLRWGIEIDIHPSHLLVEGTTRDKRRDRQCHLIGWQVDRVTAVDMIDISATTDELVGLFHARAALLARSA
jgi:hypothetical protein